VGRSTTSAVVISILLVVLIDLTFTYLFYSVRPAV
jgi:ABC-type transporter Mla maintaining outer membrane lipid asymmetry permease subunit MlaE